MRKVQARPLAAIVYGRELPIDDLLLSTCGELRARGVRLGGVFQRASGNPGACASSVHVVDLRSGAAFDIWEPRGACSHGCRLDERGLVDAEATLLAAIEERVDLLVINRFGRAESHGRGLIGCFAAAIEASIPVLTAVRAPYDDAWRRFHGGLGQELAAEATAAVGWAMRALQCMPTASHEAAAPASR
jgi:hypothetical protein